MLCRLVRVIIKTLRATGAVPQSLAGDLDTLTRQQVHVVDMLIKFLPSFLGFLDGYTDANAIVIAAACDHPLAQAQP